MKNKDNKNQELENRERAKELSNKGVEFIKEGEYAKAVDALQRAIELNPDEPNYYQNSGAAYAMQQKYDEAIKQFNKAIKLNPNDSDFYFNLGISYNKLNEYEEAIQQFKLAIQLNPNEPDYYCNLGAAYDTLKQFDKAIEQYKIAIQLNPDEPDYYHNIGVAYDTLKQFDKSIQQYKIAIQLNPNEPDYYFDLGVTYVYIEKHEEAVKAFESAIKLNNKEPDYYFSLGYTYVNLEKYEEAIQQYKIAIKLNNEEPDYYFNLGNIFGMLQKYEEAVEQFKLAIKLNSEDPDYHFYLGNTYNNLKKYKKAIISYKKAIDLNDKEPRYYFTLGNTFGMLKKDEEKNKQFNKTKDRLIDKNNTAIISHENYSFITLKLLEYYIENKDSKSSIELFEASNVTEYEVIDILNKIGLDNNNKQFYDILASKDTYFSFVIKKYNEYTHSTDFTKIYYLAIKLVNSLKIKNNKYRELEAAHYTQQTIAIKLLFEDSPFRLNSTIGGNDPEEGLTLLNSLKLESLAEQQELPNYQAFIGCFTFNHESLNQFRLYGKEENKETTGVSLALNKNFFSSGYSEIISNYVKPTTGRESPQSTQKESIPKANLYRCIYLDPLTNQVISIGQRKLYTFYRESQYRDNSSNATESIEKYKEEINSLLEDVSKTYTNLHHAIKELLDKDNSCNIKSTIIELLLPLRYLVKHIAFEEEQECRIINIQEISNNSKIQLMNNTEDNNEDIFSDCMYLEYEPSIKNNCNKIYFAPNTKGYNLFRANCALQNIKLRTERSSHPFRCK